MVGGYTSLLLEDSQKNVSNSKRLKLNVKIRLYESLV